MLNATVLQEQISARAASRPRTIRRKTPNVDMDLLREFSLAPRARVTNPFYILAKKNRVQIGTSHAASWIAGSGAGVDDCRRTRAPVAMAS